MANTGSVPYPLGVYLGTVVTDTPADIASFATAVTAFASLMGATPTFSDTGADWTQPVADWLASAQWEATNWAASPIASAFTPVIGLPMASSAAGSETADEMFHDFVAGKYDAMITGMVQAWAQAGFTTQYWKPGWEMNLTSSQPWYAGANPQTEADFVAAFQHIANVLHAAGATYGVDVQVVWNPGTTSDGAANATTALYPGSQYVDVIGADVYSAAYPLSLYDWDLNNGTIDSSFAQWAADPVNLEHYWTYPGATQSSPTATGGNSLSLQDLINLAASQGKPLAVSETGSGGGGTQDVNNDAAFPQWLAQSLGQAATPIDYVILWDTDAYAFSGSTATQPALAAAWAKYFGAQASSLSSSSLAGSVLGNGAALAGVAIALLNASGTVVGTTTTNGAGAFSFTELPAGSYQVMYTAPAGLMLETGSEANSATGLTPTITLAANQVITLPSELMLTAASTIEATAAHFGGPADPSWGTAEAGVAVALIDASGAVVATNVSNGAGWFYFGQLPGGTYQLKFTAPAGQAFEAGGPVDPATGLTAAFSVAAGQSVWGPKAELVSLPPAATLSGRVLLNGADVTGMAIALLNASGATIAASTTNSVGVFSFSGVAAGSYQVQYTAPSGDFLEAGSEANAPTALTPLMNIASGQSVQVPTEVLITNPATIQATVAHFGGATDPSWGTAEPGVAVALLNSAGAVIATNVSDSNGWLYFGGLAAGTYELSFTAPAGQVIAPGTSGRTAAITVTPGQSVTAPKAQMMSGFTMSGTDVSITQGAGSYIVTGTASDSTLTLGAGNSSVTLTGTGNTVTIGNGNETITLSGGSNAVTTGTGSSTISASGANNVFNSGPGIALFNADGSAGNSFMLNPAAAGTMTTINGFNLAAHDILDIKRTLAGTGIAANLSNVGAYVTATTTGANTTLLVDPTGGYGTATAFTVLDNLHTTVSALAGGGAFSLI